MQKAAIPSYPKPEGFGHGASTDNDDDDSATATTSDFGTSSEGDHSEPQRFGDEDRSCCGFIRKVCTVMGPGLMACLADTDGPCLLTAAESGAQWDYSLLLLQLILIPILYAAQELTARLALVRGAGMVALLRMEVGPITAWLVSIPLLATCILGLVSEYGIISQMMEYWGTPVWVSNLCITAILIGVAATGNYSVAERVGLVLGMCQVIFFATIFMAEPDWGDMAKGLITFPIGNAGYAKLITANIGAVIMPWMLAYQQSATCNKGIQIASASESQIRDHLKWARLDTASGSALTQGVMAAMLISVAAARAQLGQSGTGSVDSVDGLVTLFTFILGGELQSKVLLTFAIIGACMVAAIVQTLCAAWTFEQAMGRATATELPDCQEEPASPIQQVGRIACSRPLFYGSYVVVCGGAFIFTLIMKNAVDLSVWTEFCNGILMPPVIFSLWYLASYKLPPKYQLGCVYRWLLFFVFGVCSLFCLGSIYTTVAE